MNIDTQLAKNITLLNDDDLDIVIKHAQSLIRQATKKHTVVYFNNVVNCMLEEKCKRANQSGRMSDQYRYFLYGRCLGVCARRKPNSQAQE